MQEKEREKKMFMLQFWFNINIMRLKLMNVQRFFLLFRSLIALIYVNEKNQLIQ